MARLDQLHQVPILLRIAFKKMPRRHVQRGNTGLPPPRGEIIHVHPRPVSRIEEGPQTRRPERRLETQDRSAPKADTESARSHARPEAPPPTAPRRPSSQSRHQRSAVPALLREHLSARRATRKPAVPDPFPTQWKARADARPPGWSLSPVPVVGRKPNISASDDSPSRINRSPCSTRPFHSADAGAPVRATKMRETPAGCRCRPIDERIAGHAPASSESTV